jgi:signal transduction histidine kinase
VQSLPQALSATGFHPAPKSGFWTPASIRRRLRSDDGWETSTKDEGETIEVTVADIGPGIVDDVADQLFQPFVFSKSDGIGLGLSISRSILRRMTVI